MKWKPLMMTLGAEVETSIAGDPPLMIVLLISDVLPVV